MAHAGHTCLVVMFNDVHPQIRCIEYNPTRRKVAIEWLYKKLPTRKNCFSDQSIYSNRCTCGIKFYSLTFARHL